jgi:hypothetical protein
MCPTVELYDCDGGDDGHACDCDGVGPLVEPVKGHTQRMIQQLSR